MAAICMKEHPLILARAVMWSGTSELVSGQ